MNIEDMDVEEQKEALMGYAEIECDSLSQACLMLIDMHGHAGNLSDKLNDMIEEQITKQLKWYQENMIVRERCETYTHKIISLERK